MRLLGRQLSAVFVVATIGVAMVSSQNASETFTATASVKKAEASASAPFTVTITRYASDADREAVRDAVRKSGSDGARTVLTGFKDAGFVQLGEHRVPIKFAAQRQTGGGRLVTVITAEPILYLGAGLPDAKRRTGYEVAVAMLDVQAGGGTGELAPAAKVGLDDGGAVLVEDYGASVIWLKDLRAR
jgi:hypothetical protein